MKRSSRWRFKQRLEIDLVDQHVSADTGGDLTDSFQCVVVRQHTARIVEIRYYNQSCPLGHTRFDLFRRDPETVFKPALKTLDVGANVTRGREHRFVRRLFKQYFVTRLKQRGQREMIGKTSTRRRHDRACIDAVALRDFSQQRSITVTAVCQLEII